MGLFFFSAAPLFADVDYLLKIYRQVLYKDY